MKLPSHASESVKRLNPDLYGLGGLRHPERKPDKRGEVEDSELAESPRGVGFRIVIISLRAKLADVHDNLRQGAKPLVDAICNSLGFASDSDPRLVWEYHRVAGQPHGTIILIELL